MYKHDKVVLFTIREQYLLKMTIVWTDPNTSLLKT